MRGEILLKRDPVNTASAEDGFLTAIAVAQQQKARSFELQEHIDAFITAYNENAQPFAWKKKKVRQRRFKGRRITRL